MIRHRCLRPVLVALGLALVVVGLPRSGWAQDEPDETMSENLDEEDEDEESSTFQQGPSVRRKILYRSTRFEAAPMLAMTAGNAYMRDAALGASFNYYLTNAIGLGLTAGYSPLHLETDLAGNVKDSLGENSPDSLEDLKFSFMQWFAGVEFKFVPLFGKFSVMNSSTMQYDLHVLGGLTMVGRGVCGASSLEESCAANTLDESESGEFGTGFTPAGTIGVGLRLFVGEAYALNLQVRDHLYRRAEAGTDDPDPEFSSNLMVNLGFSFFFPQTVKISR